MGKRKGTPSWPWEGGSLGSLTGSCWQGWGWGHSLCCDVWRDENSYYQIVFCLFEMEAFLVFWVEKTGFPWGLLPVPISCVGFFFSPAPGLEHMKKHKCTNKKQGTQCHVVTWIPRSWVSLTLLVKMSRSYVCFIH